MFATFEYFFANPKSAFLCVWSTEFLSECKMASSHSHLAGSLGASIWFGLLFSCVIFRRYILVEFHTSFLRQRADKIPVML